MNCQKCNTELAKNAEFCFECGTKVETFVKCSCGAKFKLGTKFCSKCGNALTESSPKAGAIDAPTEQTEADKYFQKAMEYCDEEKYDAAIKGFTKAISLRDEENADDYLQRGVAYYSKGNFDATIEDSTKAISLRDEENADDYLWRGAAYYSKENYAAAIEDYEKTIEINAGYEEFLRPIIDTYYEVSNQQSSNSGFSVDWSGVAKVGLNVLGDFLRR